MGTKSLQLGKKFLSFIYWHLKDDVDIGTISFSPIGRCGALMARRKRKCEQEFKHGISWSANCWNVSTNAEAQGMVKFPFISWLHSHLRHEWRRVNQEDANARGKEMVPCSHARLYCNQGSVLSAIFEINLNLMRLRILFCLRLGSLCVGMPISPTYFGKQTLVHSKFHCADIFLLENQTLYSHYYTRTDRLYHNTLLHSLSIRILFHWMVQAALGMWSLKS